MKLILIRHAETEANVQSLNQGQSDSPLTAHGREQARILAEKLGERPITRVFTSDLARSLATLEPYRAAHPEVPVTVTAELREQNMGDFEMSPYRSVLKAAKAAGEEIYRYRPKNGERIKDREDRVLRFLHGFLEEYRETEEVIVFFTHGGPIIDICLSLLNMPGKNYADFKHGNACCSLLEVNKREIRILALNVACTENERL